MKIPYLLSLHNSSKIYHPKDIANFFIKYEEIFYNLVADQSILQSTDTMISNLLSSLNLPSTHKQALESLNAPFSLADIKKVIASLLKNKSTEVDGFSSESCKVFLDVLAPHLQDLFDKAVSSSSLPKVMLYAIIVALPKPGKEANCPQKCRPTFLPFTKFEQVGFIKSWHVPDNTSRMPNSLSYVESHKIPCVPQAPFTRVIESGLPVSFFRRPCLDSLCIPLNQ